MEEERQTSVRAAASHVAASLFAGFLLLALVNAAAIAVGVPRPPGPLSLRLAHHAFDAAETLGLGALAATLAGSFVRLVPLPTWGMRAAAFALAVGVVYAVIGEYLALQASHVLGGRATVPLLINDFGFIGAAFVAGPLVAAHVAKMPRFGLVPALVGALLMVADQLPLRDDYAGIHGLVAVGAALVAGPALAPCTLRFAERLTRRLAGRITLAAVGLFSLFGLAVPPPNAVRLELFRQPCAVAAWVLASTSWRRPALRAPVVVAPSPWLDDRSAEPPIPPGPPLLPHDAVVVLITVDALRADVAPENDVRFRTLAAMKRDGVVFTRATAPGAQTPISIGTMFSGLYFSQQRWATYGTGADRYPYPAEDPSPRVPELLSMHGVTTVQEAAYVFLTGPFGVARGFQREASHGQSRAAAHANVLISGLLEELARPGDEPRFLFAHLAEPHAPYRVGRGATDFDHYLNAVGEADAQIGHVLAYLSAHLGQRWALIVSADHGEAFGDHETYEHAKTLYEELIHVPLLVRSPALPPRTVDQRVSLIDLGPTLLDLFGVSTPATFNGQSLVPLLAGRSVTLTRPILAEGRMRTALLEPDGLKVIEDPRRKVVEAYDLAIDPGETRNIFDVEPARVDGALAWMRKFFDRRTLRDGGYEPPYKP